MKETFSRESDDHGRYLIGYRAEFPGGGTVLVETGDKQVARGAHVRSEDEARDFIQAAEKARYARIWNCGPETDTSVWTHEQMRWAIRTAIDWAAIGPGEHRHGTLSHHGICSKGSVVACGARVPVSVTAGNLRETRQSGLTFTAYEETYRSTLTELGWAEPYDPSVIVSLIIDATGEKPIDTWNDGRSIVIPALVHPDTYAAFATNRCLGCKEKVGARWGHEGTMPDGWLK